MNKFIVGILIFLALILFQVNLPAATVEVSIMSNLKFQPDPVMINVGDMVIWKNNDTSLSHTSTSGTGCIKDGTWDTGTINPGQSSQQIAFNSQGNYPYYCTFHCSFGMTGTVMVSGGTSTTTVTGGTTTTSGPSTTTTTPEGTTTTTSTIQSTTTTTIVKNVVTGKVYTCYFYTPLEMFNAQVTFSTDGTLIISRFNGYGFYLPVPDLFTGGYYAVKATIGPQTGDIIMLLAGASFDPFIAGAGTLIVDYSAVYVFIFGGLQVTQQ